MAQRKKRDFSHRRPYATLYFESSEVKGAKPVAAGYCGTLQGARRCVAVHLVLGEYPLGLVVNRYTEKVVSHMRRNKMGLFIGDNPENAVPDDDTVKNIRGLQPGQVKLVNEGRNN
jgi:hypothetical protein